jgi:hypothetical protein
VIGSFSSNRLPVVLIIVIVIAMVLPSYAESLPPVRVSDNKRFLVTEDGKPFFWLGDTAWELFHRLNREEAERYLQDRAAKGFTVVQAVVLAELDGLTEPNPYGHIPLDGGDPTKPKEAYFEHVDWIVNKANALGLRIGMLPTWGDKWNKKWGTEREIFSPRSAAVYGGFLGNRYKDKAVIWIVGGDRPIENDTHREIIRSMATGLRKGDGGAHLITFHPNGGQGSAQWFHNETWLDFNMRQNGHAIDFDGRYDATRIDYDRINPIKPVLDGEPVYEDHPISFNAKKFGHTTGADVRRPLYWNLFSGALGHTYGHHSIWQMYGKDRKPINAPLTAWTDALSAPGASQMQYARWLLESRPFLSRIPDDSIVVISDVPTSVPGAGTRRFVATRDVSGTYAMVYAPIGRAFSVRMDCIRGASVKAWWFNPRDGKTTLVGDYSNVGARRFVPPDEGELTDWVLVLDDASKQYPPPGTRKAPERFRAMVHRN